METIKAMTPLAFIIFHEKDPSVEELDKQECMSFMILMSCAWLLAIWIKFSSYRKEPKFSMPKKL